MIKNIVKILIVLTAILFSCNRNYNFSDVVRQWMGKEINLPESMSFILQGDTIDYNWINSDYKIITFVDSIGCSECQMRLPMWQHIVDKLNSSLDVDVSFIMVVETGDAESIVNLLKQNYFCLPVVIDTDGKVSKMNQLPPAQELKTFLLDSDNRVVAIGNPAFSKSVYTLYENIINGEKENNNSEASYDAITSSVRCKNIGVTFSGQTKYVAFDIINNSDEMVIVDKIVTSCDCTKASLISDTIKPESRVVLNVEHYVDSAYNGEFEREIMISFENVDLPMFWRIKGFVKNIDFTSEGEL
ncbi:MAG: DUF1573 domain-containing protein [Lachnospiraceae bacterium]|nr:DUF1573 domain-containing protein [Lachnospiraceae bacterium]